MIVGPGRAILFFIEMVLKMGHSRAAYFYKMWNQFDFVLLVLAAIDRPGPTITFCTLPLDCLLTPSPFTPLLGPLNCLETRSGSFWNPLSRRFWAAAFGRRPEESRGEGPEASRASFETV